MPLYNLVLHHADQKLLDRAAAETVDNLADGARRHVVRPLRAFVNVGSAFGAMRDVALFLEAPEDGADRGVFQRALRRQSFANLLGGGGAMRPEEVHDKVLQLTQSFL